MTGSFFPATTTELLSGAAFHQSMLTLQADVINNCISRLGFGQAARQYLSATEKTTQQLWMPGWQPQLPEYGLVDLSVITRTRMVVPIASPPPRIPRSSLPASEIKALQADAIRCDSSRFRESYAKLLRNGLALRHLWSNAEYRLQESSAVRPLELQFGRCAEQRGVPHTAAGSLLQFQSWLMQIVNPSSASATARGGPSGSLQQREQLDAHWTGVFGACAQPLLSALQNRQRDLQKTFLQRNYQEINVLESQAAGFIARMQRAAQRD